MVPTACSPACWGHTISRTSHSANSGVGSVEGLGGLHVQQPSLSLCDPGTATHQGALVPGQRWVRLLSPSFWEPSSFSPSLLPLRPWTYSVHLGFNLASRSRLSLKSSAFPLQKQLRQGNAKNAAKFLEQVEGKKLVTAD